MKKKFITMAVAIISVFTASLPAKAFDLKDILGGDGGGIVGNLLEGVFTKTDLHQRPYGSMDNRQASRELQKRRHAQEGRRNGRRRRTGD